MPQDRKRRKSEDGPRATRATLESQRNWLVIIAELKTSPGKKKKEEKEEKKRKQPAVGINSGGAVGGRGGGGGAITMGWEISAAQTWWNFCSC